MEDHKNVMKFAHETVLQRQKMEAERNTQLKSRQIKVRKISMIVICLKIMTLIHG